MKKILLLLLSVVLVFSLTACGNNETPSGNEGSGTSQTDDKCGENSTVNVRSLYGGDRHELEGTDHRDEYADR